MYDIAAALLVHLGVGELRDVKEARDIDAQDCRVVGLGVLRERFAERMPALLTSVLMRPNRAMPSQIARSAVFRSAMSPKTTMTSSPLNGSIESAVATTRYFRSRCALTRATPMPPDAPVTTATFCSLPIEASIMIKRASWTESRSGRPVPI